MTFFLIGMCYSGKTTIGKLLSQKLNKKWLDSREIFTSMFGISENEYLIKYGKNKFQEAEQIAMSQNFGNYIISLSGSAIYYSKQMQDIKDNHTVIWLNASLDTILKRKSNENYERPIVFPDGINTFNDLYNERYELYKKYHTVEINIKSSDSTDDVVQNIIDELNYKRL